jgi:dipeptide/tripeptide permease
MVFLALFGWLFLFTQQMQFVLGYDPLQAGVRALPFAVTIGAVSQPAAKLAARFGTKKVVTAGLALMAVGFALMATSTTHTGYSFLLPASLVIAAGMGLSMAPATESIMGSLPPAQAGVGSAVNDTTRSLGGALGVAVMGSIASSVFASRIGPALVHVPATVAAGAKTSVGAAVTVAQHAPGPLGHSLVQSARQAFVTGSDLAMIGAMAAALVGSLVAARFLPARARNEAHDGAELQVSASFDLPAVEAA